MPPLAPRALILSAMLLAGMAVSADTVYVPSSSTILLQPTSYYYVPTTYSYVSPTGYTTASCVSASYYTTPTTYIVPTTYSSPARYVVRRYVQRPVVSTTSYVPTTYYLPTTVSVDLPVLSTSSTVACCETVPAPCETAS